MKQVSIKTPMERKRVSFIGHLKRCSKIVKTWPEWKQSLFNKNKKVNDLKCKKHGVSMEVAPGGHFYCPECEAEQEDMTINLCETCCMSFADCPTIEDGVDFEFGDGVGGDNVYRCDYFEE